MNALAVTLPEIAAWSELVMWPFLRVSAMFSIAPLFGSQTIPVRIRVAAALVLSVAMAPAMTPAETPDPLSALGVAAIASELFIGLSMGFALQLVFAAFHIAGELVATTMGLGMARMNDPVNGAQVPVIGQLFFMMGMLVFLSLNGHLALLGMLAQSFRTLPVAGAGLGAADLWTMLEWSSLMFRYAMQVALPAVTALLAANVMLGVITRSAPQLNLFAFGLPITTALGLALLLLILPELVPAVSRGLASMQALVSDVYLR